VKNNYPIGKVLLKLELAGRIISWLVEFSKFDLTFKPRRPIKSQSLADFALELQELPPHQPNTWTLYVDESSYDKGCGAEVVLENLTGMRIEQSLCFNFKTSNNQADYETLIAGLTPAKDMGASS